MSRVVAFYAVVAGLNVVSFVWASHDLNKLGIAALVIALIYGHRNAEGWRQTAEQWRHTAEAWRREAHR